MSALKHPHTAEDREACFRAIERAACEGARCPENGTFGVQSWYVTELCRDGRIRSEISGRNYRTITILTGPHAGKRTRPNPNGAKPWKIADANDGGTTRRVVGFRSLHSQSKGPQPSAPQLLKPL